MPPNKKLCPEEIQAPAGQMRRVTSPCELLPAWMTSNPIEVESTGMVNGPALLMLVMVTVLVPPRSALVNAMGSPTEPPGNCVALMASITRNATRSCVEVTSTVT